MPLTAQAHGMHGKIAAAHVAVAFKQEFIMSASRPQTEAANQLVQQSMVAQATELAMSTLVLVTVLAHGQTGLHAR